MSESKDMTIGLKSRPKYKNLHLPDGTNLIATEEEYNQYVKNPHIAASQPTTEEKGSKGTS
jgi:hypothetical protein